MADYAAKLALIEILLGSVIQGLKVPFGGHILSLNQSAFLTLAVRRIRVCTEPPADPPLPLVPLYISSAVATLKTLSPVGQKFGPMLSISVQGFLFSLGILFFGSGRLGCTLGFVFASFWAFLQPAITLYIFFGASLIEAAEHIFTRIEREVPGLGLGIVLALPLLKALLAAIIGWRVSGWSNAQEVNYLGRWEALSDRFGVKGATPKEGVSVGYWKRLKLAIMDLARPMFLFSFALLLLFFSVQSQDWVEILWWSLRPVAVAFLFFYFSRSTLIKDMLERLQQSGRAPFFFAVAERVRTQVFGWATPKK